MVNEREKGTWISRVAEETITESGKMTCEMDEESKPSLQEMNIVVITRQENSMV